MKNITVLGTGVVARTISEKLSQLGYIVVMGTRDVDVTLQKPVGPDAGAPSFGEWCAAYPAIRLADFAEAAAFGELAVNATSGAGSLQALELAGRDNLAGKVLLDIANPLDFSKGMPPSLTVCNTDSLAEQIQKAFPDTKVVKSLNTMNAHVMVNPSLVPGVHNVFMSGNDEAAKQDIGMLLQQFGWLKENIIDMGDISTARGTEMLLPVWIRLWGALKTPMFNFHIAKGV